MNIHHIKDKLGDTKPTPIKNSDFYPAAVNIVLLDMQSSLFIIFTRRSRTVATHKGQFSFPGGQRDELDKTLWDTAARETEEEIGLNPDKMELIGRLDDFLTISDYRVRPFVSYYCDTEPLRYKIQKSELDYVVEIPLEHLLNEDNLSLIQFPFEDHSIRIPHFWYYGNVIWGITGFILFHFLKKIGGLGKIDHFKETEVRELVFKRDKPM